MKEFEAHILVVDDDDGIRDLVKQYLNEKDFVSSNSLKIIEEMRYPDITKNISTPKYPPLKKL